MAPEGHRPDDIGDWATYRRLILAELDRMNAAILALNGKLDRFHQDEISKMQVDIAMLQVKSSVWGALAGLVVAVGVVLIKSVLGH